MQNIRVGFVAAIALFLFTYGPQQIAFLSPNEFAIGLIVVIIFFVAVPFLWQARERKKEVERAYRDFDPREDIPLLEKTFCDMERRVKILRWTPETRFGEGSIAPRNIHFEAREVLPSGVVLPLIFQMPVLTRTVTGADNDFPVPESRLWDWSGAKKYDEEPLVRPVYIIRPRAVKAQQVKVEAKEEAEEGEEESEE